MNGRDAELPVTLTRWISDDPQPGIVEFQFADNRGRSWSFVEKQAVVSSEKLNSNSQFPRSGSIKCHVLSLSVDGSGREIAIIDTQKPWGIESVEGLHKFSVFAEQLVYTGVAT